MLHFITLRYVTLHTLHYITLHHVTFHYVTLHYITLHYVTLRYISLRYVTLHYITLHYITLHYVLCIHRFMYTWMTMYLHISIYICRHACMPTRSHSNHTKACCFGKLTERSLPEANSWAVLAVKQHLQGLHLRSTTLISRHNGLNLPSWIFGKHINMQV